MESSYLLWLEHSTIGSILFWNPNYLSLFPQSFCMIKLEYEFLQLSEHWHTLSHPYECFYNLKLTLLEVSQWRIRFLQTLYRLRVFHVQRLWLIWFHLFPWEWLPHYRRIFIGTCRVSREKALHSSILR